MLRGLDLLALRSRLREDLVSLPVVRLMSSVNDVSGIPTAGKRRIIVAVVDQVLHFRIFDGAGKMVVDLDETKLTAQGGPIEDLRKQLQSLWPPHKLTKGEKALVIDAVTSIVDQTLPVDFGVAVREVATMAKSMLRRRDSLEHRAWIVAAFTPHAVDTIEPSVSSTTSDDLQRCTTISRSGGPGGFVLPARDRLPDRRCSGLGPPSEP